MTRNTKFKKGLKIITILTVLVSITALVLLWFYRCSLSPRFACGGIEVPINEVTETSNVLGANIEAINTDKAVWWNGEYSYAQNLTITNVSPLNDLAQDTLITARFNHEELVNQGKSFENAEDLRLVYYENGNYIEVPFKIENPDTPNTQISFALLGNIEPLEINEHYCLYYGNELVKITTQNEEAVDQLSDSTGELYTVVFSSEKANPIQSRTNRKWILKNTKDYSKLELSIDIKDEEIEVASASYELISEELISVESNELEAISSHKFKIDIDPTELPVGEYQIKSYITTSNDVKLSTATHKFLVSNPLYVTWTIDWEGYDTADYTLKVMEEFSAEHGVPIVHFWNPRAHMVLNSSRLQQLLNWLKNREAQGDEIGLHLHMFTDMVAAAGVTPQNTPNWAAERNKSGSDTPAYVYSYEEHMKILEWSKDQFEKYDLKTPKTFRAGGWMADENLIKALDDSGFVLDSSGRTNFSLGEYKVRVKDIETEEYKIRNATNNEIQLYLASLENPTIDTAALPEFVEYQVWGKWNLSSTSKPYQISENDINSSTFPSTSVWEFSNNGADSWRFTTAQLIQRFNDNYNGQPLEEIQVLTYLTHPHAIQIDLKKLDPTFDHIDQFAAKTDQGPIIYSTFKEPYLKISGKEY